MKTKLTLDLQIEMGGSKAVGTECIGYMPDGTTYKELVKVFGKTQHPGLSADGKIQAEWFGRINGLDFIIYDYKSDLEPKANMDWHIGGRTALVSDLLVAYFKVKSCDKDAAK